MATTKAKKKVTKKVAVKGATVRVAWNREASDILEEQGWEELKKAAKKKDSDITYDEIKFKTPAEARAYARGIDDGNGWSQPAWEIV